MKKRLIFGLALALLTAAAAAARAWQRGTAFEPDTGLLTAGMPATWCVVLLAVLAAGGLLALALWGREDRHFRSYLDAFALPAKGLLAVYLLAGGLLTAAGILGVAQYRLGLSSQLSRFLFGVALLPTGVDLALVGWLGTQRREGEGRFAWPLLLPGYCACLWLISAYQEHTANPNTMAYVLYFLGAVAAGAGCYLMASFSFEKPQGPACLWLSGTGIVFLSTAVVDFVQTGDTMTALVCLGYILYLAVQLLCLLLRWGRPPQLEQWEPEQSGQEVEIEVTEHEQ